MFPVSNLLLQKSSAAGAWRCLSAGTLYLFYCIQLEGRRKNTLWAYCSCYWGGAMHHAHGVSPPPPTDSQPQSYLFLSVQRGWMEGEDAKSWTINIVVKMWRHSKELLLLLIHDKLLFSLRNLWSWNHPWDICCASYLWNKTVYLWELQPEPIMQFQQEAGGSQPLK